MVHIVGRCLEVKDGPWECEALCGQWVPEGPPISLDDAGERLCPECRKAYDAPSEDH